MDEVLSNAQGVTNAWRMSFDLDCRRVTNTVRHGRIDKIPDEIPSLLRAIVRRKSSAVARGGEHEIEFGGRLTSQIDLLLTA